MKSDLNKYELVKDTLVLILAGGRGSRLHELTDKRAKPALYFVCTISQSGFARQLPYPEKRHHVSDDGEVYSVTWPIPAQRARGPPC